jgi:hypothetical protein
MECPVNLASRGVTTQPTIEIANKNMKTETTEKIIAPMKSSLMNAPIMMITRIAKRAITIFPTNRSRLSNSSAHESHTGAVKFTDWCRLKRMKCPYLYADVSRVCVTSLERHREHSYALSWLAILVVVRYIVDFARPSISLSNVIGMAAPG